MEFANMRYIKRDGEPYIDSNPDKVPSYQEARALQPVVVDDYLRVHQEPENLALLERYRERDFQAIPIQRRRQKSTQREARFPSRVLLELTSKCNMNCIMCPRTALKRPKMHMAKETALRCIDEIDAHGVEGLWLYNIGESLLHPDFTEILDYCRDKNLGSLWLSTNGRHITDAAMDVLLSSNLTFINYSLNAMHSESYDAICGGADYKNLVANLEKLLRKKREQNKLGMPPWIRIQMIEQAKVASEIDEFLATYSGKGEVLSVNALEAFSQTVSENICYAKARVRKELKRCNRIERGDCFIFADGEVAFCGTDFNHEMSIGNISGASLEEIWSGEHHQKFISLNAAGRLNDVPMCELCLDYDL